ncbi:CBN-MLTN-13 protein [Aphelenchoides avenae]|nr:CBN-MLTN-13 protein [Aphelenchus avenae]
MNDLWQSDPPEELTGIPDMIIDDFCIAGLIAGSKKGSQQQTQSYVLRPSEINTLFERATVMSLLKSKAKATLPSLPATEKVAYDDCSRSADTAVKLAKCVVALLDARDRYNSDASLESNDYYAPPQEDERILAKIVKAFWPKKDLTKKKHMGVHSWLKHGITLKPSKATRYSTAVGGT